MVMDSKDKPLSHWDWKVLFPRSHKRVVRLDVPLPNRREDLNVLLWRFNELSKELMDALKGDGTAKATKHAMQDTKSAFVMLKGKLADLQREWEEEYRELHRQEMTREQKKELTADEVKTPDNKDLENILHVVGEKT